MYLTKLTSGGGRGDYEVAGDYGSIKASDLLGHDLRVSLDAGSPASTGLFVSYQGGKRRLRRRNSTGIQIQRQVAAALLLPKATRDETTLLGGQPTIKLNCYVMRRILLSKVELQPTEASLSIAALELSNGSNNAEEIDVPSRMLRVKRVHQFAANFVSPIKELLAEHQELLSARTPVPRRAETIVQELMPAIAEAAPDYDAEYVQGTDVLGVLETMIDAPVVERPLDIAAMAPDEIQLRRREAMQWRRWAAARGGASVEFRRKVRLAYDSRCIVCGQRFPQSEVCRVPGVDSAHILPWAQFDLDIIPNGLCLCKNHHWAFDQQLIAIYPQPGVFRVVVTPRAQQALGAAATSLAGLRQHEGLIPLDRLPARQENWPSAQLLHQLYEEVPPR